MRFIGYFSFWLNNQLLDVQSGKVLEQVLLHYHITNLIIHLVNGILIFAVVQLLVKKFAQQLSVKHGVLFSALVMTLWLLHPLNTQAVTYTIQRLASLVTLFYLLALYSYLKIRLFNFSFFQLTLFVTAVCLGMLTKQNFIVLFVLIYFIELLFIEKNNKKIILTSLFLLLFVALIYPFYTDVFTQFSNLTKETQAITRFEYFNTQLMVLGIYVYKFLVPINLQLQMGIDLVKESTGLHFIAFVIHCFIIAISIVSRKKIPLITMGVLIFYTGHSIESFIIPITDLAFEHRTYLPNIGLVLVFASSFFYLFTKYNINRLYVLIVTFTLISLLAVLTYQRNTLWQAPDDFYLADYKLAPNNPRAMESYALVLIKNIKLSEGEQLLRAAVNKNFKAGKITVTSLNNLMGILFQLKKYQSAINTSMIALKSIHKPKDRSEVLTTIAFGYIGLGYCDFSIGLSTKAIELNPGNKQAIKYQRYCKKQLQSQ
jgi:hypothetical protein